MAIRSPASRVNYKLSDLIKAYEVASSNRDTSNMATIKAIYDSKNYINDVDDVKDKSRHKPVRADYVTSEMPEVEIEPIPDYAKTVTPAQVPEPILVKVAVDPLAINLDLFKPTIE